MELVVFLAHGAARLDELDGIAGDLLIGNDVERKTSGNTDVAGNRVHDIESAGDGRIVGDFGALLKGEHTIAKCH